MGLTEDEKIQVSERGPGKGTLMLILGLASVGCFVALLVYCFGDTDALKQSALGVLGGWFGAGILGVSGWWTSQKALSGGRNDLLKYMVGGMLLRLMACGLGCGLVVGLDLLERNGFILGFLVGMAVFLAVEIGGLYISSKRFTRRASSRGN